MTVCANSSSGASKEKSALIGVVAGLADTVLTALAFLSSNSAALLADTLKTLLEFCAALISYIVMRKVSNASSVNFNYGTGKLESLSGLLIGSLMCACLLAITANAIYCLFNPSHISGPGVWAGMALQTVYAGVNGWLYKKNLKLSKEGGGSTLLKSQANLFLSKMLANVFIFASLLLGVLFAGQQWAAFIDPVSSLIVGMFIIFCAMGVFSSSIFDLMDKTLEESDQLMILRGLARHFDSYRELHGIRSRRAGGKAFIEIFLEFEPEMNMSEAGRVAASIKADIEREIPNSQVAVCLASGPL